MRNYFQSRVQVNIIIHQNNNVQNHLTWNKFNHQYSFGLKDFTYWKIIFTV